MSRGKSAGIISVRTGIVKLPGTSTDATPVGRYPQQIKFIIGNEAGERFSYYGMLSILTL